MEFTKTVYIGDIEFEVTFDATESKPAKLWGDNAHPAEGGEAEVSSAEINGVDVWELLSQTTQNKINQAVLEMVDDCFADADDTAMADAAEHRDCE